MTDQIGADTRVARRSRVSRRRRSHVRTRRAGRWFGPLPLVFLSAGVILALMLGMFWLLFVVPVIAFLGGVVAYAAMAPSTPHKVAHGPGLDVLSDPPQEREEP